MTKDNEQYAYLTVVGDFRPESVTAKLGLEPSEAWKKGDQNERTHLERKFSRWSIDSRLERSASLEDHVRDVLEQVLPNADQIRQVATECKVWVQLVGFFHNNLSGVRNGSGTDLRIGAAEHRRGLRLLLSLLRLPRRFVGPPKRGGLNRSMQHYLAVYSLAFESPRSLAGVGLDGARSC